MRYIPHNRRKAVVLLAVLLVVVLLSLAAYKYSDYMLSEARATEAAIGASQARFNADSGVAYVAAMLGGNLDQTLGGNPWDNPQMFRNIAVPSSGNGVRPGRFSILALRSPDEMSGGGQAYRFGVTDEGGKLNINSLPLLETSAASKGTRGLKMLMALPNMTEDIARSILAWLGCQQYFGQESEYYSTQTPPYRMRMGPIDSLEELLLVRGVTPQLLFGNDRNRNGSLDSDEDGDGQADLGWSAYLTVYSREANADSEGNARLNVNNKDLAILEQQLTPVMGQELTSYIVAYRMYGGAQISDGTQRGTSKGLQSKVAMTDVSAVMAQVAKDKGNTQMKLRNISRLWDLVNSQVTVTTGEGNMQKSVAFPSPLNSADAQRQLLPVVLDKLATTDKPDIRTRINVLTAPTPVLAMLKELSRGGRTASTTSTTTTTGTTGTTTGTTGDTAAATTATVSNPLLTDADIQTIISKRPSPDQANSDPLYKTAAWLVTECNLPIATVRNLDRYITGTTQVYRFQAIGYFEKGGPVSRIEAVVDRNLGRPRIVYWRDLTELGRGFEVPRTEN